MTGCYTLLARAFNSRGVLPNKEVGGLGPQIKFGGKIWGINLSLIFLEAKFGAPTRISEANFGAKPPDLLIWKHPPGL